MAQPGKTPRAARANASDTSASGGRIGPGTRIRGRVTGEGDLLVEGAIEGDIALRGALTIAEDGSATSAVSADEVTVAGSLVGDVESSGLVRVFASGRLRGDVHGAGFVLEEGASFAGRVECEFDLPAELARQR